MCTFRRKYVRQQAILLEWWWAKALARAIVDCNSPQRYAVSRKESVGS